MEDTKLLFFDEYEQFYKMTGNSKAFKAFCRDAFGQDFSQDGFSDLRQIDRIVRFVPAGADVNILDVA